MDIFFHPNAITVIGASKHNLGGRVVKNLQRGYKGQVFPVNPNYEEILGFPCFSTLEDIPYHVDLAIVLVPAHLVPSVLEACARKGLKRVIIESAGFAEVGGKGIELQDRCKTIAQSAGIRIWGPNCMGFVDIHAKHFFTFMHPDVFKDGFTSGQVSLIVQSGMLSAIFLTELSRRGIGIAKACSIGNRLDVDDCDLLQYLIEDQETEVIALYLESIPRGELFAYLAKCSPKPIVLLKGARSKTGARAAMSHTYSLSGNSRLLDSVLQQCGVILANDIYEMMEISHALTLIPNVPATSRTAILTLSGGAGILACDALERHGLQMAQLSEKTRKEVSNVFPDWMPVANPIDLFPALGVHGRTVVFKRTISSVLEDPNVDILLIHYIGKPASDFEDLAALKKSADAAKKIVFFWLMGNKEDTLAFHRMAQVHSILVHGEITRIAEILAAVGQYGRYRAGGIYLAALEMSEGPEYPMKKVEPLAVENSIWDEYDSKRLLKDWHIPVVKERLLGALSEAKKAGQAFGFPVVLKGLLPEKTHKTEFGLVHLGITGQPELEAAFRQTAQRVGDQGRILIQKQIKIDYELIAGFLRDKEFGPCVMFGLGGIFAELNPDVAFALAPLKRKGALALLDQIRGKRLLKGFRGMAPLKEDLMADILVRLGDLGFAYPQIDQIDINPVAVSNGMPVAVDAAIVLNPSDSGKRKIPLPDSDIDPKH